MTEWRVDVPAIPVPRTVPAILDDIAVALRTPPPPADRDRKGATGLLGGEPGFALYLAYLDRVAPSAAHRRTAHKHLRRALITIPQVPDRPFFSYGFSGAGWTIQHLGGWFVDIADDPIPDIEVALLAIVERAPRWPFDHQRGLVGYGIYAIERLPRPGAVRLLEAIVDRLERTAEPQRVGIAWRTPADLTVGIDIPDEGFASSDVFNGSAGVVGLLGAAIHHGIAVAKSRALLGAALDCLWSRRDRKGLFVAPAHRQLSWASGSLGIASVMRVAARAAGLVEWEQRALTVARKLATVRPTAQRDATLAGGAAGTQHMFHRLYRATGDAIFARAAHTWSERLLRRRRPGQGLAGYRTYSPTWQRAYLSDPKYPVGWIGLPGLSNGIAGIGLSLLSLQHAIEPAWDRAFLLSQREVAA